MSNIIHVNEEPIFPQRTFRSLMKKIVTLTRSLSSFKPGECLADPHFLEVDRLALRPFFNTTQWVVEMLEARGEFKDVLQPAARSYWLNFIVTETGVRLSVFETTIAGPGVRSDMIFRKEEGNYGIMIDYPQPDSAIRWRHAGNSLSDQMAVINPYEPVFCFEHEFDEAEQKILQSQILGVIRIQS